MTQSNVGWNWNPFPPYIWNDGDAPTVFSLTFSAMHWDAYKEKNTGVDLP